MTTKNRKPLWLTGAAIAFASVAITIPSALAAKTTASIVLAAALAGSIIYMVVAFVAEDMKDTNFEKHRGRK